MKHASMMQGYMMRVSMLLYMMHISMMRVYMMDISMMIHVCIYGASIYPTPRIALFVRSSVTNLPHHRFMHQGQGSWIFALWIHAYTHQGRGSRIIIRVKDHGYICIAHTHSSYMHTPGSRIKDICIIHTCIKIKGY